jgi:hypothetical protein
MGEEVMAKMRPRRRNRLDTQRTGNITDKR